MGDRLLLIGLGPHARTYYVKIAGMLSDTHDIEIAAIVDLKCQEQSVRKYLADNHIDVKHLEFLNDENRNNEYVTKETAQILDDISDKYNINKVVISTEPKAHKAYALWAAGKGLSTIMDKPLTAIGMDVNNPADAFLLKKDFDEIKSAFDDSESDLYVMALRRVHPALCFAKNYLEKFIGEFGVPITHIAIMHSEGMWNMPNEYFERENHPYKYGYGLMLHSGYHFVDLFLSFLRLNNQLSDKKASDMDFGVSFTTTEDLNNIIDNNIYKNLLQKDFEEFYTDSRKKETADFGEVDVHILCNANHDGKIITTGNIDLLQTSYSTRYRWQLPEDTYKDNGRTYHECINIEVGHLLNIKMMCYTVGKAHDLDSAANADERYRIQIYRNSNLVGGKSYEEVIFGKEIKNSLGEDEYSLNMGTSARLRGFYNWLYEKDKVSNIDTHETTISWLATLYETMFKARIQNGRMGNGKLDMTGFSQLPTQ